MTTFTKTGSGTWGIATADVPVSTGSMIYQKQWEDGAVNDGFWGFQNPSAVTTGNVVNDSTVFAYGGHSGRFDIPADSAHRQAAEMLSKSGNTPIGTNRFAIPPNVTDYYSLAWRISSYQIPDAEIAQYNYQGINASPLFLHLSTYTGLSTQVADKAHMSLCLLVNAGENAQTGIYSGSRIPYYSGLPQGGGFGSHGISPAGPYYIMPVNTIDLFTWYEVIVKVKWTSNLDGETDAWWRVSGASTWNHAGPWAGAFPTAQWGWSFDATTYIQASSLTSYGSTDKFGCYRAPSSTAISVWHDCYRRSTGFTAAEAAFA